MASRKLQSTHTERHLRKKNKNKKRIPTGNFSNFYAVKFKFQMGSFRSHHAWQKVCFCLSGEKAKASLADMHDTRTLQRKLVLTVAGVRFVPLLQRGSCSLLFLLAILVTATLENPFNSWDTLYCSKLLHFLWHCKNTKQEQKSYDEVVD